LKAQDTTRPRTPKPVEVTAADTAPAIAQPPAAGKKKITLPQGIGTLTGALLSDMQYLFRDAALGTPDVPEKFLNMSSLNLSYSNRNFSAGVRIEANLPPLLGFDARWRGVGLASRYIAFKNKYIMVQAGNFYEQYGSGMVLRAYWEPLLGIDNSIDGFQLHITPMPGITVKGLFGRQRQFFSFSEGILRGGDLELDFAQIFDTLWKSSKTQFRIGGAIVSRYQRDQDPSFVLPENVATMGARMYIAHGGWSLYAEYAYKINDPSAINNYIYRPGQALYITTNFSWKNLAVTLSLKRLDNMDFRTDRNATGIVSTVNFLPPIAKQHTYRLPTLYLYATQNNGEMGIQFDLSYTFPRGSKIGGKYGMTVSMNYSRIHALDTARVGNDEGYKSNFFSVGKKLYYQDFNIEVTRKLTSKLRMTLSYLYISYDIEQILALTNPIRGRYVESHIGILDMTYKITRKHSLRWEVQHNYTRGDFGSWLYVMLEYSLSPHFFAAVSDEWNYGNKDPNRRFHYYGVNLGYNGGGLRITVGYVRQREGVVCIGGVCRVFPASNGIVASLSCTF
jgi:hypothetical protein